MPTPDEIARVRDLLARARVASEGSQDLDEAVHAALLPDDPWWQAIQRGRELVAAGREDEKIDVCNCNLRADSWALGSRVAGHSTSIDAALALAGRVFPGWRWVAHSPRSGLKFGASLSDPRRGGRIVPADHDHSAPLAILAALLTAKLAEMEADHGR